MKHKILLLLLVLILFAGCSKKEKLTCSIENTNEGSEFKTVINAELKDDIVTNATATMTYKDEESATNMCNILKVANDAEGNLECKGKEIIIKNYHKSLNSNGDITKEDLLEYMDNNKFTCK